MPRSNRRRRDDHELAIGRIVGGMQTRERHADGDWFVRRVRGRIDQDQPARAYLCPGCQQELAAVTPHIVAWPAESLGSFGGLSDRRHWHTPCWQARDRRPPRGSYR